MNSQVKKGILEIYVLAQLSKKESYGYEIVSELSKYVDISESTLYPILRRLEEASELETYNIIYQGRNRKYYRIKPAGITHIREFIEIWHDVHETYHNIIKGVPL